MKSFWFVSVVWLVVMPLESIKMPQESIKVIQKCCLKQEELHSNGRDCVVRSADRKLMHTANIETASGNEMDIVTSLPDPFNIADLKIKYMEVSSCKFNNFLILDFNETSRYTLLNMNLTVKFPNVSNGTFEKLFNNTQYCLDTIQDRNDSLVIRVCTESMSHAKKCCRIGELLRKTKLGNIECISEEMKPWSLQGSVFEKHIHEKNTTKDVLENVISLCTLDNFNITSHDYLQKNKSLHPDLFKESSNSTFLKYEFICVDHFRNHRRSSETEVEEVVGVCHGSEEHLKSFFAVHHLCPVAAILLLLSIGGIVIRAELRKSLHGQALACHAVALLMSSSLRAIWWYSKWYTRRTVAQCNTLAFILNYFMVASAIWLNIICINTVIEIRNAETGKKMPRIRTILCYLLYGWVVPAFHTVLVVLQPWQENEGPKSKTHVFHTRTCFFKDDVSSHHKLEKFLFYYGPMTAILLTNIGLLIYSVTKCQKLQESITAMRGGERKVRPMSTKTLPEQALMYARLLISAGVGEMGAEIIAWALNDPVKRMPDGSRLAEAVLLRQEVSEKEITFWILATCFDFLRALSVFILCCLSRRTVRAIKHMFKGYVRLDLPPTTTRVSWPFRSAQHGQAQENVLSMEPLTPTR